MPVDPTVKPIPDGYHSVTPYLMVKGAATLIEFTKSAFGATETERVHTPDGAVMHAEITIGDSVLMVSDARGAWQPMPAALYLYVADVDATYARAIAAGAKSMMEPADQFYGDRHGGIVDPAGNHWWIATRIENVSKEELARRADAFMRQRAEGT